MIPTVQTTATGKVRVTLGINPEDVYRLHREYLQAMDVYYAPRGSSQNIDNSVRAQALELAQSYSDDLTAILCPEFDVADATALARALTGAADDLRARWQTGVAS